jgi:hypothetical protein
MLSHIFFALAFNFLSPFGEIAIVMARTYIVTILLQLAMELAHLFDKLAMKLSHLLNKLAMKLAHLLDKDSKWRSDTSSRTSEKDAMLRMVSKSVE